MSDGNSTTGGFGITATGTFSSLSRLGTTEVDRSYGGGFISVDGATTSTMGYPTPPITSPKEVVATLREAADIMEEGGIIRGTLGPLYKPSAPHCMLGAIYAASVKRKRFFGYFDNPAVAALANFLPIPAEGVKDHYNSTHVGRDSTDMSKVAAFSNIMSKDGAAAACMMRGAAEFLEEKEKLDAENQ